MGHGEFATIGGCGDAAGGGDWALNPALRTGVPGDFVSLLVPDVPAGPMQVHIGTECWPQARHRLWAAALG